MSYDVSATLSEPFHTVNGSPKTIRTAAVTVTPRMDPAPTYLDYRHSPIEAPELNHTLQNHREDSTDKVKLTPEPLRVNTAQIVSAQVPAVELLRPTIRPVTPEGGSPASRKLVVEYSPSGSPVGKSRTGYRPRGRTSRTNTLGEERELSPLVQDGSFLGIQTPIPTGQMEDTFAADNLQISKTGTVYIGGRQAREFAALQRLNKEKESSQEVKSQDGQGQESTHDMHEQANGWDAHGDMNGDISYGPPETATNTYSAQERASLQEPGYQSVQSIRPTDDAGAIARATAERVLLDAPSFNKADESVFTSDNRSLSLRVRSLYGLGAAYAQPEDRPESRTSRISDPIGSLDGPASSNLTPKPNRTSSGVLLSPRSVSGLSTRSQREPGEAAGGVEDWTDVSHTEVDRYGFIRSRSLRSKRSFQSAPSPGSPDQGGRQRPYTPLPAIDETTSHAPQANGQANRRISRTLSGTFSKPKLSARPSSMSLRSARSRISPFEFLRSPRTRQKHLIADAQRIVSTPTGPSTNLASLDSFDFSDPSRSKLETTRAAKWEKMARPIPSPSHPTSTAIGAGKTFTFDTADPKLISRTWKGIPDRWRATAWHAFLSASAGRASPSGRPSPSDADLTARFHALQDVDCPDDVQIDIDVPRTIGQHVMFRRRYRGGQRLLFRVLHALTLHFPDIGYVQGMAALVATLVCYFEEERAFVVAVRLWTLRGVAWMYREGFGGLMTALTDFETGWIGLGDGGVLRKKLEGLDVSPTIWGAKWYLTLFNYSLPFQAQLRVWDVFMLLGDTPPLSIPSTTTTTQEMQEKPAHTPARGELKKPNLDVLHAVAAALLLGLRDRLLKADFEGVMECLTAPVAVLGDGAEDALMRVARGVMAEAGKVGGRGR